MIGKKNGPQEYFLNAVEKRINMRITLSHTGLSGIF